MLHGLPMLDIAFPNFVAIHLIDIGAAVILIVVILGVIRALIRWHRASIPRSQVSEIRTLKATKFFGTIAKSIGSDSIAIKPLFSKSRFRWGNHLIIMWGFIGLTLTTTLAYIFNPSGMPEPFDWPVRILGNVSGALLVLGCTIFFVRLVRYPAERNTFTLRADLIFFGTLFLAAITGFVTEFFGYRSDPLIADIVYGTHLIFVILLLASAPFTRFLHAMMTPYIAIFERLRATLAGERKSIKFKDRRIENYVADSFFSDVDKEKKGEKK
ncbi:MAG: hypothetical protein M1368_02205 [Thaumarchaeota archaeon]|nr:hypothetical protein [Nitrososphaerota archaeon]